jgi:hypothetical protein
MKRFRVYPLAAPIAAVLLAATMAGSSAQAPLVQRLLTLRLTEVGGLPAVTTGEVGCTGATINGKQYPGARSFPVPERILDFPFQSVSPPVCTLVLSNLTDDEQLSVTINGVAVPRSGVSIVNAATKEIQATFSPIPLDGTTEVLIRTKPVAARNMKIAQIDASISTEMATQFLFTATVFDCVGVVWTDTYPGTGTENYRRFPGVTSAQCKVRFTPTPGQKVITDFRTHVFFAAGRLVTPTFEPDGSAVVNFPLAQISGLRVISPVTPAPPLSAPATTKPKPSPVKTAGGDSIPEDVQDFTNGVCASLDPKTKKVTVGPCKAKQLPSNAASSGLVEGPVSLPENQPVAELLDRFRSAYANMYANPAKGKSFLAPIASSRSKFYTPPLVTRLAKAADWLYSAAGPEQFEFLDVMVKPLTRTTAEIRACVRFSFELRNRFSNDTVSTTGGDVSQSRFVIEKNASGIWKLLKDLPNIADNSDCANATALPSVDPARIRPLEQTFPLPRGGEVLLEAAKKYLEAVQESSQTKGVSLELYRGVVTPTYFAKLSVGKWLDTYWTGSAADSVLVRERATMVSTTQATVEFCRVFGADRRNSVTEVVDPSSVGVKVTSIELALSKVKGKWLVDRETYTEPDFGYSNCWVGATLPANLANPRTK